MLAVPDQEEIEISQLNAEETRGRVALLERLKDHLWIRWRNELRNSHRLKTSDAEGQTVSVGDVVIVHEDGYIHWKLGFVHKGIQQKTSKMCLMELRMQRRGPDEKQHAEQTDKGGCLWKISCFRNINS